jgi:hypothetical protein
MKCISNRKSISGGTLNYYRGFRRHVQRSPPHEGSRKGSVICERKNAGSLDPKLEIKGFQALQIMNKEKEYKQ